ncbi:MAG: GNAT family N-acetyltransferase [Sphingorhabdus sp.]
MATRAVNIGVIAGSLTPRLDSWRAVVGDALTPEWDDLAEHACEPNAFAESWFLTAALEQFDPEGRVQLFTLWNAGQLVALMPLSMQAHYGRWPMRHLQNWLHHNAFLGTPLVRSGHESAFWTALLPMLDADGGQALFAHFNSLAVDGPLVTALKKICRVQSRRYALVHREERALLEGNLAPDAYFEAAVRGKKRKELRRQKNRLAEEGVLSFARFMGATGLEEWTAEFLALERAGWKGGKGSALDCSGQTRSLFTEALQGAATRGKLERLELRLDGKPLAMLVNFLCTPGSFSFKTAFDENYARFSPGVLLQIENLALLERADIAWCDSCAAEGHPMIDSLWTGRRAIGRYSVAIGGSARRAIFGALLNAELARSASRNSAANIGDQARDDT